MQNIEYLVEEVKEKNIQKLMDEKRNQYDDIIAESKISLIKLKRFASESPIISPISAKIMFILCKALQWTGIVSAVIQLPILLARFENFKVSLQQISDSYNSILFGDSAYLTYFLLSLCAIVIGFLGARFAKIQLHIESNRRIAHNLADELEINLERIFQKIYG